MLTRQERIDYVAAVQRGDLSSLLCMPGMTLDKVYEIIDLSEICPEEHDVIPRKRDNFVKEIRDSALKSCATLKDVSSTIHGGNTSGNLLLPSNEEVKTAAGCFQIMCIITVIQENTVEEFVKQLSNPDALDKKHLTNLNLALRELLDLYRERIIALGEYLQECNRPDACRDISITITTMHRGIDMMRPLVDAFPKEADKGAAHKDELKEERRLVMSGMSWQAIIKFIRGDAQEVNDIKRRFSGNELRLKEFRSECEVAIGNMLKGYAAFSALDEESDSLLGQVQIVKRANWYKVRLGMDDSKFTHEDTSLLLYALSNRAIVEFINDRGRIGYWLRKLRERHGQLKHEAQEEDNRLARKARALEKSQANIKIGKNLRVDTKITEEEFIEYAAIGEKKGFRELLSAPDMTLDKFYEVMIMNRQKSVYGCVSELDSRRYDFVKDIEAYATRHSNTPEDMMVGIRGDFGGRPMLLSSAAEAKTSEGALRLIHTIPILGKAISGFVNQIKSDTLEEEKRMEIRNVLTTILGKYNEIIGVLDESLQKCTREDTYRDISYIIEIMRGSISLMESAVGKKYLELETKQVIPEEPALPTQSVEKKDVEIKAKQLVQEKSLLSNLLRKTLDLCERMARDHSDKWVLSLALRKFIVVIKHVQVIFGFEPRQNQR